MYAVYEIVEQYAIEIVHHERVKQRVQLQGDNVDIELSVGHLFHLHSFQRRRLNVKPLLGDADVSVEFIF